MRKNESWKTLLVLAGGLIVFYFVFKVYILLYISFLVLVIAFLSDSLSEKIAWLWMKLAKVLGWINSKVILSLIYFLILTPIAFIYRLTGKNSLQLKKKEGGSWFIKREHEFGREDMENMW